MARSLRLYGNGISFTVVSRQSSCLARICSVSASFLVVCASLSQDGFQREGFWEVAGCIVSCVLLLAPPELSRLVFGGSTLFLIGTSCCETTHAICYHCAWPRRAVSVNSFLREQGKTFICFLRVRYHLRFSYLNNC